MRRPDLPGGRRAPRLHPSLHAASRLRGPAFRFCGAPFATLSSEGWGFEGRLAASRLLLHYRWPGGSLASEPSTTSAAYPFLALSSAACLCVSGWASSSRYASAGRDPLGSQRRGGTPQGPFSLASRSRPIRRLNPNIGRTPLPSIPFTPSNPSFVEWGLPLPV